MSPSIKRLQYRNKRKIAFRRLPFVGVKEDAWAVPATGGYVGGSVTGDALAAMFLKHLRAKEYVDGSHSELGWIVFSMIERAGGTIDEYTPEGEAFIGQIVGFFGSLNGMLLHASKTRQASVLDRLSEAELLERANAGLNLDSEPATV